ARSAAGSMAKKQREPALRSRSSRFHQDLIDVAPAPVLARLERGNDRVLRRAEVLGRVFVLRLVATPDVAAGPAQGQIHPAVPQGEASPPPCRIRRIRHHEVEMLAIRRHGHPLYFSTT